MPLLMSEIRKGSLVLDIDEPKPFERKPDFSGSDQLHEVMLSKDVGVRVVCDTEMKGYETAGNVSLAEIVLDSSQGVIPLWGKDVTLRWRFRKADLDQFADPRAAQLRIEKLLAKAIRLWGDGVPVKFAYAEDAWDFQIVVREQPQCSAAGCVLASAFFPDAGQHDLVIYPTMFEQSEQEQVETLALEIGHIFGLRHFFALVKEAAWPAVVWGTHDKFSIMNYGTESVMTKTDRHDLKLLYSRVWSGETTEIAGTPIRLVRPFHEISFPALVGAAAVVV